jgi:hypothetical protein
MKSTSVVEKLIIVEDARGINRHRLPYPSRPSHLAEIAAQSNTAPVPVVAHLHNSQSRPNETSTRISNRLLPERLIKCVLAAVSASLLLARAASQT